MIDRTVDNVQNCDSYINISSSETYRFYLNNNVFLYLRRLQYIFLHKEHLERKGIDFGYIALFVQVIWFCISVIRPLLYTILDGTECHLCTILDLPIIVICSIPQFNIGTSFFS
jgi:hypothetical protein